VSHPADEDGFEVFADGSEVGISHDGLHEFLEFVYADISQGLLYHYLSAFYGLQLYRGV
jgi:hypothetical protein